MYNEQMLSRWKQLFPRADKGKLSVQQVEEFRQLYEAIVGIPCPARYLISCGSC